MSTNETSYFLCCVLPPPPPPHSCENNLFSGQQQVLFPQLLGLYRCSQGSGGGGE